MSSEKLFLLDGTALAYRAFFALIRNPLYTRDGRNTSAVYGFVRILYKILQEFKPEYMAVVFDAAVPTFRHEKYAEYKKNRPPAPDELKSQFPLIRKITEAFGIRVIEVPGYEADDVMAYFAGNLPKDWELYIVSSDKDIMQLVNERVKVIAPVKGISEIRVFDAEGVREKYGVPPEKIPDLLALMGDSSDNIPGVQGIGEKTARMLLERYDSLEQIYENIHRIYPPSLQQKLAKGRESAFESRELAILKPAPVGISPEELKIGSPDYPTLAEIFMDLEFKSLMSLIPPEFLKGMAGSSSVDLEFEEGDISSLYASLEKASVEEVVVLRNDSSDDGSLFVGWRGKRASKFRVSLLNLEVKELLRIIKKLFEGGGKFTTWDFKGILHSLEFSPPKEVGESTEDNVLSLFGFAPRRGASQEKASSFEGNSSSQGFREILLSFLNEIKRAGKEESEDFFKFGDTLLMEYLRDPNRSSYELIDRRVSKNTLGEAFGRLFSIVESFHDRELIDVYERIEKPLPVVLFFMEKVGVGVDLSYLKELSRQFSEKINQISEEIFSLAGERFNINSPSQLQVVLFRKLGLPPVKKTKTGFSTDNEVLKALEDKHPIIPLILEYRTLMKLKSSYVDALPRQVNPATGRIHAKFHQCGTATGRLSSSDPNLQNIPARGELGRLIRNAFVASEGKVFISADYSQIELRVLAHLSGDEHLKEIFTRGEDVHTSTASKIFNVPPDKVTQDMRRLAKVVNFGIVYGMSPHGLSVELGISHTEAKEYIDNYFRTFPGVKEWIERTISFARESGYVRTLFGRKRAVPEIKSANPTVRKNAERVVVNSPVQGTAADLMKMAMVKVFEEIAEADILIQVHDELILEVEEAIAESVAAKVKKSMETVYPLEVPLVVETSVARKWGELK